MIENNDFKEKMAILDKKLNDNSMEINSVITTAQVMQTNNVKKGWWRADEAMTISSVVLIFGLVILFLIAWVMRKTVVSPDSILRIFGTIIIIISSIFLVVSGYSEQQIVPVIGLLGTVAGYLLGKSNSNNSESKDAK
jgi:quinol-cytochrome oxidoreductase complex cytochrome b subunit